MKVEILAVDQRFPYIPKEMLREAIEKKIIPVLNEDGKTVGTLVSDTFCDDGSITGTIHVDDKKLQETLRKIKEDWSMTPVMGLSYTAKVDDSKQIESLQLENAALVGHKL